MRNSFVHRLPTGYSITHEQNDTTTHQSDEDGIPHHAGIKTAQDHEIKRQETTCNLPRAGQAKSVEAELLCI